MEIQIILRLYNKPEEILIGFDVDSCCVGFNGKQIITTPRGLYSFQNRVNVAQLSRRSPSYENRLIKYSQRGFDVVTDFDYKQHYNKLFFMSTFNNGFVRLFDQELINNGKSKSIVFNNTLRFRPIKKNNTKNSMYQQNEIKIRNMDTVEERINGYNAMIEDSSMKFTEYNNDRLEFKILILTL